MSAPETIDKIDKLNNCDVLRDNPRPDTDGVSRTDALGWLSAQAVCGIPEAAKLEQEIARLQALALRRGASTMEVYQKPVLNGPRRCEKCGGVLPMFYDVPCQHCKPEV